MKQLALFGIVTLLLSACAASKSKPAEDQPLEGTYWVLTELNGKEVAPPANGAKPYYIYFNKEKKNVAVSGGCNSIGGGYEVLEGNRIKFGNLRSTMMACPDMTVEEGLKRMAEMVDNYAVQGENLMFAKARMAPVARFKAAKMPKELGLDE